MKTTLPKIFWPLMKAPSMLGHFCHVCGRPANNKHHMVRRNAGELIVDGRKMKKPVIVLCGSGTTGCHGLAHQNRLHFRYVERVVDPKGNAMKAYPYSTGTVEYLECDEPTKYQDALDMDGWQPVLQHPIDGWGA